MKVKYRTILLSFLLLLFVFTVPAMGWPCPGSPPGPCYTCQDGVWVPYGNCNCPACCYACVNCWCTWIGVTGSLEPYIDPVIVHVGWDVTFILSLTTGVCGADCFTWSGGGEPATQEGGHIFVTHWDTTGTKTVTVSCCGASFSRQVIVFDLDLAISGVSEEQEEDPGKYIPVNNDDDNNNGTADYADTGTVTGEDDLVAINLSITPTPNLWSAVLGGASWDGGACPIKVWESSTKGTEIILLKVWDLSQETLPATLYVEGVRAGDATLCFWYGEPVWCDCVVFHVCKCDSCGEHYTIEENWHSMDPPFESCSPLFCDGSDGDIKKDDCGNTLEIMCAQDDGTGGLWGCAWRYFYNGTLVSSCIWGGGINEWVYKYKIFENGDKQFYQVRQASQDGDCDEGCTEKCCAKVTTMNCLTGETSSCWRTTDKVAGSSGNIYPRLYIEDCDDHPYSYPCPGH